MKTIETTSDFRNTPKGCVLTIGNFDGVHLGHRHILDAAKRIAAERQTQLLVMTFDPHPLALVNPQKKPGILTPLPLKIHLLGELAVDCLLIIKTTPRLLALTPEDYVSQFLLRGVQPAVVVEGESFSFGRARSGNAAVLQELAGKLNFDVSIIPAKQLTLSDGQKVTLSSTIVRNLLARGRVADAASALDRPYRLIGRVVPGRGKGKKLGFPTANIEAPDRLVPAQGVYAGFVAVAENTEQACKAGARLPAAISIGTARTIAPGIPLLIEAHILTGDVPDLNGKSLAIDFVEHIRSQQKFETENHLAKQITKDCEKAKNILAKETN